MRSRQCGPVLWLALQNPPVNFLTTDLLAELHQAIRAAERDDSVRVLVLTGGLPDCYIFHFAIPELVQAGRDVRRLALGRLFRTSLGSALLRWSTALGLRLMRRSPAYERLHLALTRRLRTHVPTLHAMAQMAATCFAIENCRKPTIAAINGSCNGGGTELSACFDFRFMVGDAGFTIGQPEVLVGIIAGGGGTQRVTRLIGRARAIELMLACDQLSAQEARQIGLITDHFPKAEFEARVQAFAERIARRSLLACTETRRAITRGAELELTRGLALETAGFARCCDDAATQAALADYAAYLQAEVIEKLDTPASIAGITRMLEGEGFARRFAGPADRGA